MGISTTISPLSSSNTNPSTIGDARSICSSESKSSDQDKTSYRSSNSSLDRLDESNTLNISANIIALLRNGVPENDIVLSWLREFSYEDYAENFLSNGYDIQTIIRMTPEVNIQQSIYHFRIYIYIYIYFSTHAKTNDIGSYTLLFFYFL
jgi:hypothetical protein